MSTPSPTQLSTWGASLREIDPDSLIPDEDGAKVRWFLGDNGTELFVWSHGEAAPHHLQLVFARVSVEWETGKGLMTGTFRSQGSSTGGRYDPYLLSIGQTVDLEVCAAASTLLAASKVPPELRRPLDEALTQASATPKPAGG